jgi:hypothetical protein
MLKFYKFVYYYNYIKFKYERLNQLKIKFVNLSRLISKKWYNLKFEVTYIHINIKIL